MPGVQDDGLDVADPADPVMQSQSQIDGDLAVAVGGMLPG